MTNTVSLALAKELWELGLKIETEKWWIIYDKKWECVYIKNQEELADVNNYYPAYSTDELLACLAPCYKVKYGNYDKEVYIYLQIDKHPDIRKGYRCAYYPEFNDEAKPFFNLNFMDKSLPETLGLMCKHLLINGYIFNGKEIVRKGE